MTTKTMTFNTQIKYVWQGNLLGNFGKLKYLGNHCGNNFLLLCLICVLNNA